MRLPRLGLVQMKISELIERLGRTVFEAPFGAMAQTMSDSPEVAEIRIAVLDEVSKKIQRAGGQALFPYNVVRIVIRAAGEEGAVFERDFFRRFFDEEVRKGLSKEACRFPEDLRVEIRADEPSEEGKWLRIETCRRRSRRRSRKHRERVARPGWSWRRDGQQTRDSAAKGPHEHRPAGGRLQIRRSFAPQRSGVCRG